MQKEKRTAVMTIRITPSVKAKIDEEAELKEWTPSYVAERIISMWAERKTKDEG